MKIFESPVNREGRKARETRSHGARDNGCMVDLVIVFASLVTKQKDRHFAASNCLRIWRVVDLVMNSLASIAILI